MMVGIRKRATEEILPLKATECGSRIDVRKQRGKDGFIVI